ncbi:MAG: hypothetical protein LBD13_04335 [Spirochaetaceae bacterium]|jgi:hypothetical protein|nr:hypothetical protein [Spirochaetaceae bacterium]
MKKFMGVAVLFFAASVFVTAQTVTAEWAQVDGKPNIKFINKNPDAMTVQYAVKGEKPASIDIPANSQVTLPYAGKTPNAPIDPPIAKQVAKPKALPKGAVSEPLGGAAAPAPAPAPAPAAAKPAPAPAKK